MAASRVGAESVGIAARLQRLQSVEEENARLRVEIGQLKHEHKEGGGTRLQETYNTPQIR